MTVFISGQKYFGEQVLRFCLNNGFKVMGVCCPLDDNYIGRLAITFGLPIIPAGTLNGETFPEGVDLGISAHSFDYIGKRTRHKAKLGWIGYHPSLLPRHRGRNSIEWAIRMRDAVTGGTVFWLNAGIDRGDIAYQKWCFIDPSPYSSQLSIATKKLWRECLLPIGIELISQAITDIGNGTIIKIRQDARFSTWEPSTAVKDVYKPDLIMLSNGEGQ